MKSFLMFMILSVVFISLCSAVYAGDVLVSGGGGQWGYWQSISTTQWVDPQGRPDISGGLWNVDPSAGWRRERKGIEIRWHGEAEPPPPLRLIWAPGPENEFFKDRNKRDYPAPAVPSQLRSATPKNWGRMMKRAEFYCGPRFDWIPGQVPVCRSYSPHGPEVGAEK